MGKIDKKEIIDYVSKSIEGSTNFIVGTIINDEGKIVIGYIKDNGRTYQQSRGYAYEVVEKGVTEEQIDRIIERLKNSII